MTLGRIKPVDHVASLPANILNHRIFQGSTLELMWRNNTLTYGVIFQHINQLRRCDDLTFSEREFIDLLQAQVNQFNAQWEFE